MMRILAIVPAYNEEGSLEKTVRSLEHGCPGVDYLVVNDGSTDATAAICDELGLNHIDHDRNLGLSAAFHTGIAYAALRDYDAAIQFDADGQHRPEYVLQMAYELDEKGADIVIGSRALAGCMPSDLRSIGSALIRGLIRATSGTAVGDPTSGMRMYGRRVIEALAADPTLQPEPDMLAIMARRGARIVEVPAVMHDRETGKSYLSPANVVRYMTRVVGSLAVGQFLRHDQPL